jgi:hypothetical protein
LNIPRSERQAAGAVIIGPRLKLDRPMREVLHELHHDRAAAAFDIQYAPDVQNVGATQCCERGDEAPERFP